MKRVAFLALASGLVALNPVPAQERPKELTPPAVVRPALLDRTPAPAERAKYVVKNADPAALVEAVAGHFHNEARITAAPAGSGGVVLVSGSVGVTAEVVKLLEQLDRKPRAVEVEVAIIEIPAPKDGKEPTAADLLRDGKGQRVKLTAVEGQAATSTTGGSRPFSSSTTRGGAAGGAGGFPGAAAQPRVTRSVNYHQVGTTVKATATVGAGDAIAVELSVQESKVRSGEDEEPSLDNGTLAAKVSLTSGKPVVAQAVRTDGKAGATISAVVVTAKVVEDRAAVAGK